MPLALQLPSNLGTPRNWAEAADAARDQPAMQDALTYFHRVLGERWRGWAQRSHLARLFHTSIQGGVREWIRLHRLASALTMVENVELLVKDLGSPSWQRHIAAEQALEFCGRLRACEHRVAIIRPTHNRSPDVQVWLSDRPVTIEFKALHNPDEQDTWFEFVEALHNELFQRRPGADPLPFDVQFHLPALEHMNDVAEALSEMAARGGASLHDLPHGAGQAKYVAEPSLRRLVFPVEQRGDLERIVSGLGGKYRRQLHEVIGPTLLVVLTQDLFVVRMEQLLTVVRHAAGTLRGVLAERGAIGGILIHEEPLEGVPIPVLKRENDWRFAMCATEARARNALFVNNLTAEIPLTDNEIELLVGANIRW